MSRIPRNSKDNKEFKLFSLGVLHVKNTSKTCCGSLKLRRLVETKI
jgi:hypothetical protein